MNDPANFAADPRIAIEQTGIRDRLAVERSILANERTLLAYVRTALSVFVVGVSFLQFFDSGLVMAIGWLFLPLGGATLAMGVWRFRRFRGKIRSASKGI